MKIKLLVDLVDSWNSVIYHKGQIVDADVDVGDNGIWKKNMYCVGNCFYLWEDDVEVI